jgi:hypothetical protein
MQGMRTVSACLQPVSICRKGQCASRRIRSFLLLHAPRWCCIQLRGPLQENWNRDSACSIEVGCHLSPRFDDPITAWNTTSMPSSLHYQSTFKQVSSTIYLGTHGFKPGRTYTGTGNCTLAEDLEVARLALQTVSAQGQRQSLFWYF